MSKEKENEETTSAFSEFDDMKLPELAKMQVKLKNDIDDLKKQQTTLQVKFDHLRKFRIPEMMEDMGQETTKLKDVGVISLRPEMYASIPKGMLKEAYAWLEENGHGDIVKETINSSTLKAFIKEQIKEGETLPEGLFKVEPYMMAAITKS